MNIQVYNPTSTVTAVEKKELIDFLYQHLDEFGDKWEDIERAVNYALDPDPAMGGFILFIKENDNIQGVVVVNNTKMKGYIPESILVYIAVHEDLRGQGVGKKLMKKTIEIAPGDIALHVEDNNPAKYLYKSVGFDNPYLEMRYSKKLASQIKS